MNKEEIKRLDAIYLMPSTKACDGGQAIGRLPSDLSSEELKALCPHGSVIKAVRENCLDCVCRQPNLVRKCHMYQCPFWTMRMGVNPHHGKSR